MLVELAEHRTHRTGRRYPLPHGEEVVYPHPDNEHHERLVHARRVPAVDYLRHASLLSEKGLMRQSAPRTLRERGRLALRRHRRSSASAPETREPRPATFNTTRSVCSLSQRLRSSANSSWSCSGSISSTRSLIGTLPILVEASIPAKHAVPRSVLRNPADPRENSSARTHETTVEPIQAGMIAPNLRVSSCSARIRSGWLNFASEGCTATQVPNSFPASIPAST